MAPTVTAPHARATARYQHVSASKIRQVLALVKGLSVDDAIRTLQLSEKEAAEDILKVLDSAVANAEHNRQLPADELYVALAWADEGPTRKWGQPRARGRYFRIRKRTSHITVVVARYEEDELEQLRRKQESTGRGAAVQQRRRAERVRKSRAAAAPEEHDHDDHDHDHDHDHDDVHDHDHDHEVAGIEEVDAVDEVEEVDVDEVEVEEAEGAEADDEDGEDK